MFATSSVGRALPIAAAGLAVLAFLRPETGWILLGGTGVAMLSYWHGRRCGFAGHVLAIPVIALSCGAALLLAGRPATATMLYLGAVSFTIIVVSRSALEAPAKRWVMFWLVIAVVMTLLDPDKIPT